MSSHIAAVGPIRSRVGLHLLFSPGYVLVKFGPVYGIGQDFLDRCKARILVLVIILIIFLLGGFSGRFGAGTPRVNDGALLFLQHMLAKMRAKLAPTHLLVVWDGGLSAERTAAAMAAKRARHSVQVRRWSATSFASGGSSVSKR